MVLVFYYRNVNLREHNKTNTMAYTLEEAELVIRKYQLQLHKAIGNVNMVNNELDAARIDLKMLKSRYTNLRKEGDENKVKILKLESKLDALV
jgi:hypothetical protein